ncbi:MATE efflux family protein [Striga asiatica]|uniref:Protein DETOXIFICATION n=1 Tax=Striga asiatica TaxID=4170 RepID=A0A5A7QQX9_STRAF|nr:MATE efflux family protein [Striga asiatica]
MRRRWRTTESPPLSGVAAFNGLGDGEGGRTTAEEIWIGVTFRSPLTSVVQLERQIDAVNPFRFRPPRNTEPMDSEQPLLAPHESRDTQTITKWEAFVRELNTVSYIAMPMVVVSVSQYLLRAVSMMMLGHLGELALSSASIATSLANVTGFSLLVTVLHFSPLGGTPYLSLFVSGLIMRMTEECNGAAELIINASGMASALETLCGQAYGAQHYQKVGTLTYGAIIWLCLACLPVCVFWIYTDKLLILIGQDPVISAEAGKFAVWMIPSLFPYAILQSLVRYLQTQSLIFPMLVSSLACLCIHFPLSWAFIFKLKLGNAGAALAICISYWLNVIFLGLYVKYSSACQKTHAPFSRNVLRTAGEFFHFAIPSAVMVCLEWWTYELVILFSGLLPNPELETSVLSICLTITTLHYLIPYSFGAAASTRVSNELGAGKPQAAQLVLSAVLLLTSAEIVLATTVIFFCRHVLGFSFSNEESVVSYVEKMTPFLCVSIVMDSSQAVLSGIARGSGWQHIGACVNLGAYYLVGIPVSLLLGFILHLKGEGLWSGLIVGAGVQSILLGIVTHLTDLEKKAIEARRRIFDGKYSSRDELI